MVYIGSVDYGPLEKKPSKTKTYGDDSKLKQKARFGKSVKLYQKKVIENKVKVSLNCIKMNVAKKHNEWINRKAKVSDIRFFDKVCRVKLKTKRSKNLTKISAIALTPCRKSVSC